MTTVKKVFLAALMLFNASAAVADSDAPAADDVLLKPFILGSKGPGNMAEKVDAAKA